MCKVCTFFNQDGLDVPEERFWYVLLASSKIPRGGLAWIQTWSRGWPWRDLVATFVDKSNGSSFQSSWWGCSGGVLGLQVRTSWIQSYLRSSVRNFTCTRRAVEFVGPIGAIAIPIASLVNSDALTALASPLTVLVAKVWKHKGQRSTNAENCPLSTRLVRRNKGRVLAFNAEKEGWLLGFSNKYWSFSN